MITNVKVLENIHMKREAVAKEYQVLPLHACMSTFSASFPASGFDVTLTGMPNFDVISRLFLFYPWPQFSISANKSQKIYGFLITKELIFWLPNFGFFFHFAASLT